MENWIPIAISAIALGLTVFNLLRSRSHRNDEGTKGYNASWQVFNQSFLNDPDLIEIECELHPFGKLTHTEMKRVYFWFLRFNVTYSAYRSTHRKFMSTKLAQSSLANEANLSYRDQDFIKKHVFVRGYDKGYTDSIIDLWEQIDKRNKNIAHAWR